LTLEQLRKVAKALRGRRNLPNVFHLLREEIADTGRDPIPVMAESRGYSAGRIPAIRIDLGKSARTPEHLSCRSSAGAHIITVTNDVLRKLQPDREKDLSDYSLETVKMFL